MRKYLFFITALSMMMGCKKQSYVPNFDKLPQERAADQIALVQSTLQGAPNGWTATLPTQKGGGYGFYISFDTDQDLTMVGDMTGTSAGTPTKSNYRVKQDLGTELVFDTYNYISMLNDPNSSILGGESKIGYSSDIEFTFDKIEADTVFMIGKKYRQPLKLVKATSEQKQRYLDGDYKTAIDKMTMFFNTNKFAYIDFPSGSSTLKIGISPNLSNALATGKRIDLSGVLADGKTTASSLAKFSYTLDGITILEGGLNFQGIIFVRAAWKDAETLAMYDSSGKEYIIKDNGVPIVDINLLWGTKYNSLRSEFKTIYPGTSASGATILNFFHNNLDNRYTGFVFNFGRINLIWDRVNRRLKFDGFSSQNGGASGWTTTIVYSYTANTDGSYKFTTFSAASGGYVSSIMAQLDSFLKSNSVVFGYYNDNGNTYCKVTSIENPSIVMTFQLL